MWDSRGPHTTNMQVLQAFIPPFALVGRVLLQSVRWNRVHGLEGPPVPGSLRVGGSYPVVGGGRRPSTDNYTYLEDLMLSHSIEEANTTLRGAVGHALCCCGQLQPPGMVLGCVWCQRAWCV